MAGKSNGNGNGAKPKGTNRDVNGRFVKGSPRPANAGRKKGSKNKITTDIIEIYDTVFDKIGGVKGFADWAKKTDHNRGIFYRMYARRLPNQIDGTIGGDITVNVTTAVPRPKYPSKESPRKSGKKASK